MKKTMIIILMILSLSVSSVSAGERLLYFISASPETKAEVKFPVILYHADSSVNGLVLDREISGITDYTEFVRAYHTERLITVNTYNNNLVNEKRVSKFSIINMDSPDKVINADVYFDQDRSQIQANLVKVDRKKLLLVEVFGSNQEGLLIGYDLNSNVQQNEAKDIMKHMIYSGFSGVAVSGGSYSYSYYDSEKNSLYYTYVHGERVYLDWKLDANMKFDKDDTVVVLVNDDDKAVVASMKTRVKSSQGLGHSDYYILDKKSMKWHVFKVKGGKTGLYSIGEWIVGYVADEKRSESSPGKEKRRMDMVKTGVPVDWHLDDWSTYAPGILFLYNVETRKKYEIETGQGDSEVLLVDGDTVYYRVNDEIYKAAIGKNKVGDGVLIVKDEVVPDIHWAFMGP